MKMFSTERPVLCSSLGDTNQRTSLQVYDLFQLLTFRSIYLSKYLTSTGWLDTKNKKYWLCRVGHLLKFPKLLAANYFSSHVYVYIILTEIGQRSQHSEIWCPNGSQVGSACPCCCICAWPTVSCQPAEVRLDFAPKITYAFLDTLLSEFFFVVWQINTDVSRNPFCI